MLRIGIPAKTLVSWSTNWDLRRNDRGFMVGRLRLSQRWATSAKISRASSPVLRLPTLSRSSAKRRSASYGPARRDSSRRTASDLASTTVVGEGPHDRAMRRLARWAGLEPTTGGLENRCSIRLSYHRVLLHYNVIRQLCRPPKYESSPGFVTVCGWS